jgi:hypothetical protein
VLFGNTPADLQCKLDLLKLYCDRWGLIVKTEKTKVVVFRKWGNIRPDEHWHYANSSFEVVDNFNYLGTVFSYNRSFKVIQDTLIDKGLEALNVLLINLKNFTITPLFQCQLFDAFVGSILNYACEVWGYGTFYYIEKVHLNFCRRVLIVKTSTSKLAIFSELGRYPLFVNRYCRIIKFWCNIVQSKNIISNYIYADMLDQLNKGKTNWLVNVKKLLDSHGFSNVFHNQDCVILKTFHLLFKERVFDICNNLGVIKLHWAALCFYIKSFKDQSIFKCI